MGYFLLLTKKGLQSSSQNRYHLSLIHSIIYRTQSLFGSCNIILFMVFAIDICVSVIISVDPVNFTCLILL